MHHDTARPRAHAQRQPAAAIRSPPSVHAHRTPSSSAAATIVPHETASHTIHTPNAFPPRSHTAINLQADDEHRHLGAHKFAVRQSKISEVSILNHLIIVQIAPVVDERSIDQFHGLQEDHKV